MAPAIRVRRIYDDPQPGDGSRVLVDRLWPRGLRKDAAALDEWLRDAAPSNELRGWYGHDPAKFAEFRRRYTAELAGPGPRAALGRLRTLAAAGPVTLLTATAEVRHRRASRDAMVNTRTNQGTRTALRQKGIRTSWHPPPLKVGVARLRI